MATTTSTTTAFPSTTPTRPPTTPGSSSPRSGSAESISTARPARRRPLAPRPSAAASTCSRAIAWLPSIDGNYRILSNWSAYGQLSTGTIVPPSNVYDYNQTVSATNPNPHIATAPKQQRSTTYQFGTVVKLKRLTMDADFYHIRFQNSYSSFTDQTTHTQNFYLQPASITKGFEAEGNI